MANPPLTPTRTPTSRHAITPADQLAAAGRAWYADRYARLASHNRSLRVAILALAIVAVGLVSAHLWTLQRLHQQRPLVVRINDIGKAEAVRYDATSYTPREPELRYFLHQFIVWHFGRVRSTMQRDYTNSLLFLAPDLAQATVTTQQQTRSLEQFLDSADPDVEIQVRTVAMVEIRTPPYRATADYERVYYHQHTRRELTRERYTGTFDFVLAPTVPHALVTVNPLGLIVTYYREDRAF